MENLSNEAPQWAKQLDERLDNLLEAQTPKERKQPENEPKQGKKPDKTDTTDQQIADWSKTNRDGKIYGNY